MDPLIKWIDPLLVSLPNLFMPRHDEYFRPQKIGRVSDEFLMWKLLVISMDKPMIDHIYLPKDIREKWAKFGKDGVLAFLRDGLELIENYAEFKEEALPYLEHRPKLKEVLSNE